LLTPEQSDVSVFARTTLIKKCRALSTINAIMHRCARMALVVQV
jgi:hypothetical protein